MLLEELAELGIEGAQYDATTKSTSWMAILAQILLPSIPILKSLHLVDNMC